MDRLSFFFQQLVGQADLNTLEDDIENATRNVVADILGFGFLLGGANPATVVQNSVPDLNVKINQLLGYDQVGKRLSNLRSGFQGNVNKGAPPPQIIDMSVDENAASTSVAGVGNEKTLSIFVQFVRKPSTPRTDGNNATVYYNQDESVQFNVVQSAEAGAGLSVPPPFRSNQILLADVVLTHLQTTIVNANISQGRRQTFALLLPHGSSHTSVGSDPIPDAVASGASGLFSGADKAKLDSITSPFSAWIGTQLAFQYHFYKPANITAPSAAADDVTSRFVAIAAGGGPAKEGVVTQTNAADSIAELYDVNGNEIKSPAGNRIYGKLTVDNETTPTAWTLSFFTSIAGVETAFDFTGTALAGATLQWRVTRSYRLDHLPSNLKPWLGIVRNQAVGIPAVKVAKNGAGTTNPEPTINVIEGANVTITVTDNPGQNRIDVTIAATAAGGFPGFGSATLADTPGGAAGGSGLAADANHQHALSSQYGLSIDGKQVASGSPQTTTTAHPRLAVGVWYDGSASGVGVAFGTSGPTQASTQGGTGNTYNSGFFSHSSGSSSSFTTWANGNQVLTPASGTLTITYFVLGQVGL
jgi:hypothetical protein